LPDDLETIAEALVAAWSRVGLVFISGGLGPTEDDITRDAVARVLGRRVVHDARAVAALEARYRAWGRGMTEAGKRQALVVEGAHVLLNPVGAASGERIEHEGKLLFILPGPPVEFRAVLEREIVPWLRDEGWAGAPVPERIFQTCGIGESDIVSVFEEAGFPGEGLDVAYCAGPGRVEVRLTSRTADAGAVEAAADRLLGLLGDYVFARGGIDMEEVVLRGLNGRGLSLATLETGTSGLVMRRLSDAPARHAGCYVGGVVVHRLHTLVEEFGVSADVLAARGAASEEVAVHLAEAIRLMLGADLGLCLAGPGRSGETAWVAINDAQGSAGHLLRRARSGLLGEYWVSQMALDRLRRRLGGHAG
jgi:nicotinamide-nucleotide amidase